MVLLMCVCRTQSPFSLSVSVILTLDGRIQIPSASPLITSSDPSFVRSFVRRQTQRNANPLVLEMRAVPLLFVAGTRSSMRHSQETTPMLLLEEGDRFDSIILVGQGEEEENKNGWMEKKGGGLRIWLLSGREKRDPRSLSPLSLMGIPSSGRVQFSYGCPSTMRRLFHQSKVGLIASSYSIVGGCRVLKIGISETDKSGKVPGLFHALRTCCCALLDPSIQKPSFSSGDSLMWAQ